MDQLPQRLRVRGRPTRGGNGIRYVDPSRPGEQVRIMSRDPGALDPLHQGPYVVIDTNGHKRWIPLRGNPVL